MSEFLTFSQILYYFFDVNYKMLIATEICLETNNELIKNHADLIKKKLK